MKFKPDNEIIGYILNGKAYCLECGKRINKVKTSRVTRNEIITVEDARGTQVYMCEDCPTCINDLAVIK
jgi:ribosomal protein L34E